MFIIKLVALYNLAFGLFHLFFWKLLKWNEQLKRVSSVNKAVVQTLNLCLTFMLLLAAYLFYTSASEIHTTEIGYKLLIGMAIFWLIRALLQIILFNLKERIHQLLLILFLFGVILHTVPLL